MARIATIDTFVVFFTLSSHFFFFTYLQKVKEEGWGASKRDLFISAFFLSLGVSTKWISVFGFASQFLVLITLRFKRFLRSENISWEGADNFFSSLNWMNLIGLLLVSSTVYLLTYIPYLTTGHDLKDVFERQWSMFKYHSGLTAVHPFSSPWWSWPLILRPVWLYFSELFTGKVSTISAMGNPAIWWFSLVAIGFITERTVRKKDLVSLFITAIFFTQWIPYALISRCTFLYHYYSNVPMLCLGAAFFLDKNCLERERKIPVLAYLIGVVILFSIFYPVISGYPINDQWRESLRWLNSWGF